MTSPSPIDKSHGFQANVPEKKIDDTSKLTEHHASELPEALGERDETMEILNALRRELDYGDTITEIEGLLAQEIPAAVKKLTPEERTELRKLLPTISRTNSPHISSQRSQIGYALRDLEYADKKSSERAQKFEEIKARATNASRTFQAGVSNSMLGQKLGSVGQKIKEGFRNLPAFVGGLFAKASDKLFPSKTEVQRRDSGYEEPYEKVSSQVENTAEEDKSSEVYSGISQTENQETSSDTTSEVEHILTRSRIPNEIIYSSIQHLRKLGDEDLIAYGKHQSPEKANFVNFLVESKGQNLDNIKKLSAIWLDEQQSALINKATDHTQMLQALQKIWSALP